MFKINENDVAGQTIYKLNKKNYITDIPVHTLYYNDDDNSECYDIIKLFKEKVLGDVVI